MRAKLRGEQTEIWFPRRGRPARKRVLERAGQMRLSLQPSTAKPAAVHVETFDDALQMTFPVSEPNDDQLYREFCRMFPE